MNRKEGKAVMKNEPTQTETFSPRSQRVLIQEKVLRNKLGKCDAKITYLERTIRELEQAKARQLEFSVTGRNTNGHVLPLMLRDLEGKNLEVAAFREQRTQIQSEIAALAPTPASAAERAERQRHLARLAAERLEKDRLAEGALKGLRRLLDERAQLTAKIVEASRSADLTISDDNLDARRFEELLASLPEGLAAESERWFGWFTGQEEGLKPYVVVVDQIERLEPESLVRAGFYGFGETVQLTDREASELLRAVHPSGNVTHDSRWSYEPPRIMPLEAYEALCSEAADEDMSAQAILARRNQEQEEKLRDQYGDKYQEALRIHREELRAKGLLV